MLLKIPAIAPRRRWQLPIFGRLLLPCGFTSPILAINFLLQNSWWLTLTSGIYSSTRGWFFFFKRACLLFKRDAAGMWHSIWLWGGTFGSLSTVLWPVNVQHIWTLKSSESWHCSCSSPFVWKSAVQHKRQQCGPPRSTNQGASGSHCCPPKSSPLSSRCSSWCFPGRQRLAGSFP